MRAFFDALYYILTPHPKNILIYIKIKKSDDSTFFLKKLYVFQQNLGEVFLCRKSNLLTKKLHKQMEKIGEQETKSPHPNLGEVLRKINVTLKPLYLTKEKVFSKCNVTIRNSTKRITIFNVSFAFYA